MVSTEAVPAIMPHPLAAAPLIEVRELRKGFGRRQALRGVDLQVGAGRTLAVVGPNGAGKTTLLRILATLMRPTSGTVQVCGVDAAVDPLVVRRHLGLVFGPTFLYNELSGAENLRFYARLFGVREATDRAATVAALVGLEGRLHERVGSYSRGMAQRLSLARALLHAPRVLLLDEPDAGLDPATTAELPRLLRADGPAERAIVLTCHDLHLALTLADDVAILAGGRFVFAAPCAGLSLQELQTAFIDAARARAL